MIEFRCVKNKEESEEAKEFLIEQMAIYYNRPIDSERNEAFAHIFEEFSNPYRQAYLFAFLDGVIVGSIFYRPLAKSDLPQELDVQAYFQIQNPYAYVGGFYLLDDYQGKGIGKKLYNILVEHCRRGAYRGLFLQTHRFLQKGHTFWIRQGFETIVSQNDEWETDYMVNHLLK